MIVPSPALLRRLAAVATFFTAANLLAYDLPDLPAMPPIPARQPLGSVTMGNPANFAEVKLDFPIETGTFSPTWSSLTSNYPTKDSAWLRQAKFGIWIHFGPQAAGQSGDWYARRLYIEGDSGYTNHIRDFGHPTTAGYKEILRTWNPVALDPAALTNTFYNAGARFLFIQGVHHDQFDSWNSRYQPWNSVNLGPKRDLLGEWKTAIRAKGMKFGVTFHHEYTWWWWQSAYRADTATTYGKQGVDYDASLTNNDSTTFGEGQWWAGMDLRKLYTINMREYAGIYNAMDRSGWNLSQGIFGNHLDFGRWYATWWALRILDVIENYDPDFIYTDGNSTQPFSGYKSGSGYKCDAIQRVLAHYYNRTLQRRGAVDTFGIVKFNPNPRGIVNTFENAFPSGIKTDQPWIGEVPVGDWFYGNGFNYDPGMVVRYLLECVSRDGAAAICIAQRPDGSLDPGSVTQLQAVGNWMGINGAGIYGSRAWTIYREGSNTLPGGKLGNAQANATFTTADFRYTVGADGYLYAYCMKVPAGGAQLTLPSLGTSDGNLAAPISSVQLLGSVSPVAWNQTATELSITCPASMPFQIGVGFKIGPLAIVRPSAPTDLFAQSSPSGVTLRWSSTAVSASFTVKRANTPTGPFTSIASGITSQSFTDSTIQPGTIYYYTVTAELNGTISPESLVAPGILATVPSWQSQDIGEVASAGGFEMADDRAILSGSGSDIWGNVDEFRFAHLLLNGAGTITARVASLQDTAPWAKAGLMIRESLNANSKHAIAFLSPSNGTALQQRTATGGAGGSSATSSAIRAPYWLRLTRSGNTFTAFQSADGASWTTIGSTTITMSTNAYIGLAVCSVNDGRLMQAAFDHVSVTGQIIPAAPASLLATVNAGQVTLNWHPVAGATTYNVYAGPASGDHSLLLASGVTNTTYLDTSLAKGATRYYTVTATGPGGTSGKSNEVSAAIPQLLSAVSRKTHGGAGVFDIPISVTPNATAGIECRNGNTLVLVATFDKPVVSGSASVGAGTATMGGITFNGNTATVTLSNVANAQTLQVNLNNVTTPDGMVLSNEVLGIKVLVGDVNGNSAVNALDAALVAKDSGKAVENTNFRCDVNANGAINSLDSALVGQRSGTSAP